MTEKAVGELDRLPDLFDALQKLTVDEEDLQQIKKTKQAAADYKSAILEYLDESKKGHGSRESTIKQIREKMDSTAGVYVSTCAEYLAGQQEKADGGHEPTA